MNNRRSIRNPGHDYAEPGDYFVTVCVRNRDPLLGAVNGEEVLLSALGLIVQQEWTDIPKRFPMVRLDEFTIMPNHVRGIITIVEAPVASRCASCCPLGQPVTLRVAAGARLKSPEAVVPGRSIASSGAEHPRQLRLFPNGDCGVLNSACIVLFPVKRMGTYNHWSLSPCQVLPAKKGKFSCCLETVLSGKHNVFGKSIIQKTRAQRIGIANCELRIGCRIERTSSCGLHLAICNPQ